jgi:hypothetical protein
MRYAPITLHEKNERAEHRCGSQAVILVGKKEGVTDKTRHKYPV